MKNQKIEMLKTRLANYPGAHPSEKWKLQTDLTMCTPHEKEAMKRYGVTPEELMAEKLNRGEVSHMLFGYRYADRRRRNANT